MPGQTLPEQLFDTLVKKYQVKPEIFGSPGFYHGSKALLPDGLGAIILTGNEENCTELTFRWSPNAESLESEASDVMVFVTMPSRYGRYDHKRRTHLREVTFVRFTPSNGLILQAGIAAIALEILTVAMGLAGHVLEPVPAVR
ncbi:MAG: hypothetical protein AAB515_02770 [Patescibacteria group bacterium]